MSRLLCYFPLFFLFFSGIGDGTLASASDSDEAGRCGKQSDSPIHPPPGSGDVYLDIIS